ncbi:helix-turn-helix domain-containing protein [Pseudonocardia sp. TRM90224]|uniref:helix-turn-helix domain-containing protein n=1 Tax=Pseudonocardia sp. TRM90224 TaxID=2812678 RepID=UPI001E5C4C63|nr:AraC family transcriptional regulator [Pseudonocardia sp. TRM90224]
MSSEIITGLRRSMAGVRRPAPWLAPYVIGYIADEPTEVRQIRCVPDCRIVMSISFDTGRSAVKGLHDGPTLLQLPGRERTLATMLTPWGARELFGTGMHELANAHTDLSALLGREASQLAMRLADAPDWPARYALLDTWLTRRLVDSSPSGIVNAFRRLHSSAGTVSMEDLAGDVGWSSRGLQARFRDHVGLPPKTIARIIRFHRAVRLLATSGRRAGEVAAECGYWDQAHLNRDFRTLAGRSPSRLLAALGGSAL